MFLAEFIATFIFINVILSIKYHNGATDLVVNALCIGLTLLLGVFLIGGISGGSINPAVGVVQSLFQWLMVDKYPKTIDKRVITLKTFWVYVAGPATGGIGAGIFQHFNGWA